MEDFVTFEIAKKLKEKGFNEQCLAYYDVDDNVGLLYNMQYTDYMLPCQYRDLLQSHNIETIILQSHNIKTIISQSDDSENCVDAPTISQVLKWLRELLEIDILPNIIISYTDDLKRIRLYSSNIYSPRLNKPIETEYFDSYKEAVITGIEYVLDNLI